jgi:probable addiction module antidote protein
MNAPRDVSHDDAINAELKDSEFAAEYLKAAMEDGDPAVMLLALRRVARAHGMAEVTRRADVGEKTLFTALSDKGNPTLETITKVLHAVGLRLSVAPVGAS